jgi:hypothetical protein
MPASDVRLTLQFYSHAVSEDCIFRFRRWF